LDTLAHRTAHWMTRTNLGLGIYCGFCVVVAASFAIGMYSLLFQPTKVENPGVAAYKAPPATIVNFAPGSRPPEPPSEAFIAVEPRPAPAGKDVGETVGSAVLQSSGDMSTAPVPATNSKPTVKRAGAKRQRSVRRHDPRQRTNEFAFQPFFGGYRPWN
jgi:hypothetical protein